MPVLHHRNDIALVELAVNTVPAVIKYHVTLALRLLRAFNLAGSGNTGHIQRAGRSDLLTLAVGEGELHITLLHAGNQCGSEIVVLLKLLLGELICFFLGNALLSSDAVHNSEKYTHVVLVLCHNKKCLVVYICLLKILVRYFEHYKDNAKIFTRKIF